MKQVVALALGLLAVGCAKEREEAKVDPPSSLFESGSFQPGGARTSAAEVGGAVSSVASDLSQDDKVGANLKGDDPAHDCMMKKIEALAYSADKANALIDATADLKDCKLMDEGDRAYQYEIAEVKVRAWFGCKNADIQSLDGHPWSDSNGSLPGFDYCKSEEKVQVLVNGDFHVKASIEQSGKTVVVDGHSLLAVQTEDGEACTATYAAGNWTWADDCVRFDKTDVKAAVDGDASEIALDESVRAEYQQVVEAHDQHPWFESGSFALAYNNWSGTITFAGGSTPPTYEVSDGSVTKQGTVSEYALGERGGRPAITDGIKRRFKTAVKTLAN